MIGRGRFVKRYLVITALSILMILVCYRSAFPQAGKEETLRIGEENLSRKKLAGTPARNPFLLPPGVYFHSREGGTPVRKEKAPEPAAKIEKIETPSFQVRAILISDHIRLAAIGPHIVAVGDKLDGETILEIKNDRVILGRGDKKRTLHLQQSPVQLTVEAPSPSPTRGEDRRGAEAQDKGGRP
jgi:hypothetical protein